MSGQKMKPMSASAVVMASVFRQSGQSSLHLRNRKIPTPAVTTKCSDP